MCAISTLTDAIIPLSGSLAHALGRLRRSLEGDTLVIDTLGVERPTGGLSLPLVSEQARYVERLRKTAPDRIESEVAVTDPATLSQPWVIKLAYVRAPAMDRMFHNLFDNDRDSVSGGNKVYDRSAKAAGP